MELYLRQARDLNLDDLDAMAGFVRTYGRVTPGVDLDRDLPRRFQELQDTDLVQAAAANGRKYDRAKARQSRGHLMRVHVDEVIFRLRVLRRLVEHATAHTEGEYEYKAWPGSERWAHEDRNRRAWEHFTSYANAALSVFHVRVWLDVGDPNYDVGAVSPTVYEAAVLQLVNDLVEEVELLTCQHCARPFRRQVGRSSTGRSRLRGLRFCSPECGRRASVKAYRARKRAEKRGSDNG